MLSLLFTIAMTIPAQSALKLQPGWSESRSIKSEYATQAAAADEKHLYAISNTHVARYDRETGKLLHSATAPDAKHLNSGFVWKGKVYCAHSNYPKLPEESDIRVYDPNSEKLAVFHTFAKPPGSLVWCVREPKNEFWWSCFAHYGKDNAKTMLIKMNDKFEELAHWSFPQKVIADWDGMSASGGIWDGDTLLVSHHHYEVLYRLKLPTLGKELEFLEALASPFPGQGIAHDPGVAGGLVGIHRPNRTIILAKKGR